MNKFEIKDFSFPVKRGEVYFINLNNYVGCEMTKTRPCVVLQSDAYNFSSDTFICATISRTQVSIPDIQVEITGNYYIEHTKKNLEGVIDLGQIKTVSKERIVSKKVCTLTDEINEIDEKLLNVLGLFPIVKRNCNIINSLQGKIRYLEKKQKSIDK